MPEPRGRPLRARCKQRLPRRVRLVRGEGRGGVRLVREGGGGGGGGNSACPADGGRRAISILGRKPLTSTSRATSASTCAGEAETSTPRLD